MILPPPRSTLFPSRRSSDLDTRGINSHLPVVNHLRAFDASLRDEAGSVELNNYLATPIEAASVETLEAHAHILGFKKLIDASEAAFASQPRFFDATKRCGRIRNHTTVESHHASFECLTDPEPAGKVLCVSVRHQTIGRVIGNTDRLVFRIKLRNSSHRPKNLCTTEFGIIRHAGQDSCRVEISRTVVGICPDTNGGSLVNCIGHELPDFLDSSLVDERTHANPIVNSSAHS